MREKLQLIKTKALNDIFESRNKRPKVSNIYVEKRNF